MSSSDLLVLGGGDSSVVSGYKHLILVEKIALQDTQIFTYAVPSQDTTAHLLGWAKYTNVVAVPEGSQTNTFTSPLLPSNHIHVQIQGDNTGTIALHNTIQPNEQIRLNLGTDKQIHISSAAVLPTHKGKEEDKSTWFVRDKKKFRVRTEERVTTVRSSHTTEEVRVVL